MRKIKKDFLELYSGSGIVAEALEANHSDDLSVQANDNYVKHTSYFRRVSQIAETMNLSAHKRDYCIAHVLLAYKRRKRDYMDRHGIKHGHWQEQAFHEGYVDELIPEALKAQSNQYDLWQESLIKKHIIFECPESLWGKLIITLLLLILAQNELFELKDLITGFFTSE